MTTAAPTPTATAQLIALTDAVIGTVIDLTSAEITIAALVVLLPRRGRVGTQAHRMIGCTDGFR